MTATGRMRIADRGSQIAGRAVIALLLVASVATLVAATVTTGGYLVPGDPKAGMRVFFDKRCARCHSVLGEGGRSAPDLGRAPAGHLSAAELVAATWNHAPEMWEKIQVGHLPAPRFSEQEMTNLFAFLYSVRSLDEPGDAERGRKLLAEKKCLECHSVSGRGARAAADFRRWAGYRNPVTWIQAMWNHGAAMQKMMAARGLSWPQFQGSEMADMIAFVRAQAPTERSSAPLREADPRAGRKVFADKGCASCHAVHGEGRSRAPDLAARALPRTIGQLASAMWNHAPEMWKDMRAQEVIRPQFSNQEMADLVAYLYTERFFEPGGSSDRGRNIFAAKGCTACHTGAGGPDLSRWRGHASPSSVATALWNHGPLMLDRMRKRRMDWPRFRPGEIVDLMEYLNAGAPRGLQSRGGK